MMGKCRGISHPDAGCVTLSRLSVSLYFRGGYEVCSAAAVLSKCLTSREGALTMNIASAQLEMECDDDLVLVMQRTGSSSDLQSSFSEFKLHLPPLRQHEHLRSKGDVAQHWMTVGWGSWWFPCLSNILQNIMSMYRCNESTGASGFQVDDTIWIFHIKKHEHFV